MAIDISESTYTDMQLARNLGRGVRGLYDTVQDKKEEQEQKLIQDYVQRAEQQIVSVTHRGQVEGWDSKKLWEEIHKIPGAVRTELYPKMVMMQEEARLRKKPGKSDNPLDILSDLQGLRKNEEQGSASFNLYNEMMDQVLQGLVPKESFEAFQAERKAGEISQPEISLKESIKSQNLPQDTKRNILDDTYNPEAVRKSLMQYAQMIADQKGLPYEEALKQVDQQYQKLITEDMGLFQKYPRGVNLQGKEPETKPEVKTEVTAKETAPTPDELKQKAAQTTDIAERKKIYLQGKKLGYWK